MVGTASHHAHPCATQRIFAALRCYFAGLMGPDCRDMRALGRGAKIKPDLGMANTHCGVCRTSARPVADPTPGPATYVTVVTATPFKGPWRRIDTWGRHTTQKPTGRYLKQQGRGSHATRDLMWCTRQGTRHQSLTILGFQDHLGTPTGVGIPKRTVGPEAGAGAPA